MPDPQAPLRGGAPPPSAPSTVGGLGAPVRRLATVAFLDDFGVACMAMGVIWLAMGLHASKAMLGWLPAASAIAYTAGCLVSGPLSDRWGRRRPAMLSCLITAVVWFVMPHATAPWQLLLLMPLSGGALALLWPSVQAWLGELCGDNSRLLNRAVSLFNVCWSAGIMLGQLVAGWLWMQGHYWPFLIPVAFSLLSFAVLALTPPGQSHQELAPPTVARVSPEKAQLFLYLAWVGNFASWFCRGTIGAMFQPLGASLGFPETLVSVLIFVPSLALCLMFALAPLTNRWQYHLRVLWGVELFGIAGMTVVALARTPAVFVVGFALTGVCTGITYVSSLIYALEGTSRSRGKRSGLHEAVLGVGIIVGPIAAGQIAELTASLHAPFAASAVVFGVAMVAQLLIWWRLGGSAQRREAAVEAARLGSGSA